MRRREFMALLGRIENRTVAILAGRRDAMSATPRSRRNSSG
jgi:hypothetical protein